MLSYLSISTLSDIHYSIPISGITTVLTMTFLGLEARKNLPKVSISIFKYHGQNQCWGAGTFFTVSRHWLPESNARLLGAVFINLFYRLRLQINLKRPGSVSPTLGKIFIFHSFKLTHHIY